MQAFRKQKREYLKDKINELATKSKKNKIVEFKMIYRPRSNLVKDENDDLLTNSHNILNRWKNYFSQLLNVPRASGVRQIKIHTAEPSVPHPSPFEVEIAIAT
jgi:hypothetical protein